MNALAEVAELKAKIAELEAQLVSVPMSEAKEIAIRNQIVAIMNQITALYTSTTTAPLNITTPAAIGISTTAVENAVRASLILTHVERRHRLLTGNAVAISPRRAITALHGKIRVGKPVELKNMRGMSFQGKVEFIKFEMDIVDIAVIVLDSSEKNSFDAYLPWTNTRVRLLQPIAVIGLKYSGSADHMQEYARLSTVDLIETFVDTCALFHASYYSFDGCSGTGIVTTAMDGQLFVVGVHVASHEDSRASPPKKKRKKSLADLEGSILSSLHGHTAYSLVCEVARVPDLIEHLNKFV